MINRLLKDLNEELQHHMLRFSSFQEARPLGKAMVQSLNLGPHSCSPACRAAQSLLVLVHLFFFSPLTAVRFFFPEHRRTFKIECDFILCNIYSGCGSPHVHVLKHVCLPVSSFQLFDRCLKDSCLTFSI